MAFTGGTVRRDLMRIGMQGKQFPSATMDNVSLQDVKNADGLTTETHAVEDALDKDLCQGAKTTPKIAKLATSVWRLD